MGRTVVTGALALLRGGGFCLALGLLVWFWAVVLVQPVAVQTSTRRSTTSLRNTLLCSDVFCSLWAIQTNIALGPRGGTPCTQRANWLNAIRIDTCCIYQHSVLQPRTIQGSIFPWLCAKIGKTCTDVLPRDGLLPDAIKNIIADFARLCIVRIIAEVPLASQTL